MKRALQRRGMMDCWYFASVSIDGTGSHLTSSVGSGTTLRAVIQSWARYGIQLWPRVLAASRWCALLAAAIGPVTAAGAPSADPRVGLLAGIFRDHAVF